MSRFLFDTPFDEASSKAIERRKARAEPPPPPEPKYGQADLDAVREMARQEGVAQGRAEAEGEIEARIADLLDTVAGDLSQLFEDERRAIERTRGEAVEIGVAVARKLAGALIADNAVPMIEAALTGLLSDVRDEPRVMLRVAEDAAAALNDRVAEVARRNGFDGQLVVTADPALGPGDYKIEWRDGGAERSAAETEERVDAAVRAFLAQTERPHSEA